MKQFKKVCIRVYVKDIAKSTKQQCPNKKAVHPKTGDKHQSYIYSDHRSRKIRIRANTKTKGIYGNRFIGYRLIRRLAKRLYYQATVPTQPKGPKMKNKKKTAV